MCYYIQKVYGFEVLKMRSEFAKDENGTVIIFSLTFIDMVFLRFLNRS